VFQLKLCSLHLDTSELLFANSGSIRFAEYDGSLPCTCERFVIDHFTLKSNDNEFFILYTLITS